MLHGGLGSYGGRIVIILSAAGGCSSDLRKISQTVNSPGISVARKMANSCGAHHPPLLINITHHHARVANQVPWVIICVNQRRRKQPEVAVVVDTAH